MNQHDVRFLLSIRKPATTIQSILKMYKLTGENCSIENAVQYYTERMNWLSEFGGRLDQSRALFFCGEELLEKPEQTLWQIKDFLQLEFELQMEYKIFQDTGKRGKGDVSDRIKTGKILPSRKSRDFNIPSKLLSRAQSSYEHCFRTLEPLSAKGDI